MEKKGGFRYVYTKEKYEEYKKLPAEMKLRWLEEFNRFVHSFMPPKSKELCEKLRRGEI